MDPATLLYRETHEWVSVDGEIATIGISKFAVDALGDVVNILHPELDRVLKIGEVAGEVESVKSVSEIYAPVDGKVVEVNSPLTVMALTGDPIGAGWLFRVHMRDPKQLEALMDWAEYQEQCKKCDH
jgi:glycine cleavage system H protein